MQWYTPEGEAEIVDAQCLKHRLDARRRRGARRVPRVRRCARNDRARIFRRCGLALRWRRSNRRTSGTSPPSSAKGRSGSSATARSGSSTSRSSRSTATIRRAAASESWDAPEQVGFVLPAERGGFVAGCRSGLYHFDETSGAFELIVEVEPDMPDQPAERRSGRSARAAVVRDDGQWRESEKTGAFYCFAEGG